MPLALRDAPADDADGLVPLFAALGYPVEPATLRVRLGAMLAARRVTRRYAALCWGHLDQSPMVIEAALARHPRDRKRVMVAAEGRPSRTDAYVLARLPLVDVLRLELHTGRTHQIRVHLAHIGHPVVGDQIYGGRRERRPAAPDAPRAGRQMLHAWQLGFHHPRTDAWLEFTAPIPEDFLRLAPV